MNRQLELDINRPAWHSIDYSSRSSTDKKSDTGKTIERRDPEAQKSVPARPFSKTNK